MNAQTKVVESDNLALWNAVSKTDPRHTKKVNQRGGFTAIDAQYQIMEATRAFGPVGVGWGYTVGDYRIEGGLIVVPVTLWHGSRDNTFGPILGCAEMLGQRPDRDAPKKAITDAITKGLSQLGFNADVFLGRFDDNKYVEQVAREFAEHDRAESTKVEGITKVKERLRLMMKAGDAMTDLDHFNELLASNRDDLAKIRDANHAWWTGDGEDFEGFKSWIVRRRAELSEPEDGQFAMLVESMKSCTTPKQLDNWRIANDTIIAELDGAESRKFQLAYELHESALHQVATVNAG